MNPKELEVLKILLRSKEPMALPDVLKANPDLVKSTVAAALAKLLRENMIEVAGIGHSGKVICRTYLPTKKAQDFFLHNFTEEYLTVSDLISRVDLCVSLLCLDRDPKVVKKEIAQLRKALSEYEKRPE